MKVIDIPDPVEVENTKLVGNEIREEKETVTFLQFLEYALDGYGELAKSPKMIRQYDAIMKVIEAINGEKQIQFRPDDFTVINSAVDARNWGRPKLGRAYLPFYAAVEAAKDVSTEAENKLKESKEKVEKEK